MHGDSSQGFVNGVGQSVRSTEPGIVLCACDFFGVYHKRDEALQHMLFKRLNLTDFPMQDSVSLHKKRNSFSIQTSNQAWSAFRGGAIS